MPVTCTVFSGRVRWVSLAGLVLGLLCLFAGWQSVSAQEPEGPLDPSGQVLAPTPALSVQSGTSAGPDWKWLLLHSLRSIGPFFGGLLLLLLIALIVVVVRLAVELRTDAVIPPAFCKHSAIAFPMTR